MLAVSHNQTRYTALYTEASGLPQAAPDECCLVLALCRRSTSDYVPVISSPSSSSLRGHSSARIVAV